MHHHLCPRQVLGVRIGMAAGQTLSLDLPQSDKRLHAFMETDGCAADGVAVATGCWLGRRTLHHIDYGKIAATFVDTESGRAIRIHPNPHARETWQRYAPQAESRWHGYLNAYQVMPDDELLIVTPVQLTLSMEKLISQEGLRVVCMSCGEEIFNEREVLAGGIILCRSCAGDRYYKR
jgi:formylmethanofuran dehydrogenase subunit E